MHTYRKKTHAGRQTYTNTNMQEYIHTYNNGIQTDSNKYNPLH